MSGKDQYQKWELSMPFARTSVKAFFEKLPAAQSPDNSSALTVDGLKNTFTTPAWKTAFADPGSQLNTVLRHPVFKKDGMKDNEVDKVYLSVYALLLTVGNPQDKTLAFYNLIQEGGLANNEFVSAKDKDFAPIFEKMCALVTHELFELMEATSDFKTPYEEEDLKEIEAAHMFVREDVFLE